MKKDELGIYIHMPFCKKKCYYCDFVSYTNKESKVKEYIDCVIKEINSYELEKYNVTTIYIGGGTPSFVDGYDIKRIVENIRNKLQNNNTKWEDIEITI